MPVDISKIALYFKCTMNQPTTYKHNNYTSYLDGLFLLVTNVVNETTISPTMTTPTPTNTTTDGMMTSSSAIIATSTTPSGT